MRERAGQGPGCSMSSTRSPPCARSMSVPLAHVSHLQPIADRSLIIIPDCLGLPQGGSLSCLELISSAGLSSRAHPSSSLPLLAHARPPAWSYLLRLPTQRSSSLSSVILLGPTYVPGEVCPRRVHHGCGRVGHLPAGPQRPRRVPLRRGRLLILSRPRVSHTSSNLLDLRREWRSLCAKGTGWDR